jgi:hypothetical protein
MRHLHPKTKSQGKLPVLRRYSKLITFGGATIVFLTFIVKEGWREKLKDLVETADSARKLYTLRADNVATSQKLNGITSEIEAIRAKITGTELGMTLLGINRSMLIYSGDLQQLDTEIANLSGLAEQMPHSDSYTSRVDGLAKKLATLRAEFRSIGEQVARATPNAKPTGEPQPEDARNISAAMFAFGEHLIELHMQTNTLTKELTERAETEKRAEEHKFRIATWSSYGLYAVGWLISLVGRLSGIDAGVDLE